MNRPDTGGGGGCLFLKRDAQRLVNLIGRPFIKGLRQRIIDVMVQSGSGPRTNDDLAITTRLGTVL